MVAMDFLLIFAKWNLIYIRKENFQSLPINFGKSHFPWSLGREFITCTTSENWIFSQNGLDQKIPNKDVKLIKNVVLVSDIFYKLKYSDAV